MLRPNLLPKCYYPTYDHGCDPIHPVMDWCKVRRLVRDARHGDAIPAIIVDGARGNGVMLTGTHRSAANDILVLLGGKALIPVVSYEDANLTLDEREICDEAILCGDFETLDSFL